MVTTYRQKKFMKSGYLINNTMCIRKGMNDFYIHM